MSSSSTQPIADILFHVQCAYTSLERWRDFGLLDRERPWFARIAPMFRRIVLVTYGGAAEHPLARSLAPSGCGPFHCIANDRADEPARFQASLPGRAAETAAHAEARSAVVFTDQHFGGEVAIAIARALRDAGIRTGLVARGGYHWSWFVARDHGCDSPSAALAAAREGELCRAADVVVGSSRRMVDDLAWRHALAADRCRVIPNFVDLGSATNCAGVPSALAARDPRLILCAGRLEPQKRVDLVIRAMSHLDRSRPGVRLQIYGDGSEREALGRLITDLRAPVTISPRIPQARLLTEMSRCAAFVQCSAFEGHPKTIIEALATGTPTVVTRGPGVDDEIIPGVTGIVTRDDPESVAAAIGSLLDDPSRATALGTAATDDVRGRLSLDAIIPQVRRACADALSLNGSASHMPPTTVRWDQPLLEADPREAARVFAGSIAAYSRRLAPEAREMFIETLGEKLANSGATAVPHATP